MIKKLLSAVIIAILMAICFGCKNSNKGSASITVVPPKLQEIRDGSALNDAIESVTSNSNLWTQERYDTLRTKINSLYAARAIESAETPTEALYSLSVGCLDKRVDSEFKKPQYTQYHKLRSDLNFLKKENQFLYEQGAIGYKADPTLEKIEDIFDNYERVLSLSKSSFIQSPVFLKPFTGDYSSVKSQIENNKYYQNYFSKNSEIIRGVNDFPSRLSSARKNYYTGLEKEIENRIENNKLSSIECYKIVGDFQKMAESYNKSAFDKLNGFVTDYIKRLEITETE